MNGSWTNSAGSRTSLFGRQRGKGNNPCSSQLTQSASWCCSCNVCGRALLSGRRTPLVNGARAVVDLPPKSRVDDAHTLLWLVQSVLWVNPEISIGFSKQQIGPLRLGTDWPGSKMRVCRGTGHWRSFTCVCVYTAALTHTLPSSRPTHREESTLLYGRILWIALGSCVIALIFSPVFFFSIWVRPCVCVNRHFPVNDLLRRRGGGRSTNRWMRSEDSINCGSPELLLLLQYDHVDGWWNFYWVMRPRRYVTCMSCAYLIDIRLGCLIVFLFRTQSEVRWLVFFFSSYSLFVSVRILLLLLLLRQWAVVVVAQGMTSVRVVARWEVCRSGRSEETVALRASNLWRATPAPPH